MDIHLSLQATQQADGLAHPSLWQRHRYNDGRVGAIQAESLKELILNAPQIFGDDY